MLLLSIDACCKVVQVVFAKLRMLTTCVHCVSFGTHVHQRWLFGNTYEKFMQMHVLTLADHTLRTHEPVFVMGACSNV